MKLIENLYILPDEQCKGYGTQLLEFAIQQCKGIPTLWILDINYIAYSLGTIARETNSEGKPRPVVNLNHWEKLYHIDFVNKTDMENGGIY